MVCSDDMGRLRAPSFAETHRVPRAFCGPIVTRELLLRRLNAMRSLRQSLDQDARAGHEDRACLHSCSVV